MKSLLTSILILLNINLFAQNQLSKYLSLPRKEMIDSVETHSIIIKSELDSNQYFAELIPIKDFAQKNEDPYLLNFHEYLKALFFLTAKQKIDIESKLVGIKSKVAKLKASDEKEMLLANIEHYRGVNIIVSNKMSAQTLKHFLTADLTYRKLGYKNVLFAGQKLNNIGQYYQLIVLDYTNALKYYREAEKYIDKDPIDLNRIFFYRSLAKTLVQHKAYDEAIKYNKLGIAQVKLKKDSLRIGSLMGNIGEIILNHKPNPLSAETYFLEELKYRIKYNPKGRDDLAKIYGNLCQIEALKNNRGAADSLFEISLITLSEESDSMKVKMALRSIYKNKIVADTLLKDFESAFRHQQLLLGLNDEIFKKELKEASTNATIQYETEKFRMEADLANEQIRNSKFWFVIFFLIIISALVGAYGIYLYWRLRGRELSRKLDFEKKEAERLAELDNLKTRFFTNISHELRTPLTLLVAPIDDLERKIGPDATLTMMKNNLGRLQNLINQILDISKLEAGKMRVTSQYGNISAFLKNTLAAFDSSAISKNIRLKANFPEPNLMFSFDKDKVEKIVNNLVANALKYTPDGGEVAVSLQAKNGEIILKVKDNGLGISPENLSRIFERYYQVENHQNSNFAGTGVGLALVKELVLVMNGHIDVESKANEGTEFTVVLPEQKAEALVNETDNQAISTLSQSETSITDAESKGLLLIVEDNDDLRFYIKSIFEENYQVIEAKDGKMGLELAINDVPDLIISDLMMPNMDGLELCKALRADVRVCHVPVVMLTAKADIESRIVGYDQGADDYIAKPFSNDELKSRVSGLLRNRTLLLDKYGVGGTPKGLNQVFIQNLKEQIDVRISDSKLNVDKLAEAVKMNNVQFRRKLKAVTGLNPVEYLRNYRLEKAEKLLKAKAATVSEIAYQVGFESLSYFSKVFQEKYGKSPSEW